MYVYQVKERFFRDTIGGNKGEFCGVRFYSSLKKAEEDLNRRVEWYSSGVVVDESREGDEYLTINKIVKLPTGGYMEFNLQKYEVE